MSKTLRTAAIVVGAVALVATGVGALATVGAIGAAAGSAAAAAGAITAASIAATATAVATIAGAAAGLLSLTAAATAKKPSVTISGNQTRFQTSLDQGLPWVIGRTATAGIPVHDITYDAGGSQNNAYQTFWGVWSGDKIHRVVRTRIDRQEVAFALNPVSPSVPDEAVGAYHDWMWLRTQLGAQPEPGGLPATGFAPYPAGWSTAHGLSGKAAFSWTLKFDPKGVAYPGGVIPPKLDELEGAEAWDPRLDSSYPGGSGPQRRDDPATWGFTENPFLLGLKWARGVWHNGRRVMGIGMALAAISVPSAVYAANVADANGWKVGGVVYSTDPKWDVLKKICAAGGGRPMKVGGMLHFQVEAPRVSLATITTGDIMAKPTIPGGTHLLDRINGVIPKFRSPDHNWQLVDAKKVTVDAFVTADGRPRTRALTWELVQSAAQVAQLATYDICNSREIEGIVLPLRLRWCGYLPGDAVTIAASVTAMDNQLVVIDHRSIEPSSAIVTLTCRTETTSKHDFALGKTTVPPPQPALATNDRTGLLQPGIDAAWSAVRNDDGKRPDDNATNGADPNSPLGTTTVGLAEQKRNELVANTATAMARVQAALQQIDEIQASVNVDIDQLRADLLAAGGQIQSNVTQLATQGAQITAQQLAISNTVGDLANVKTRVAAGSRNLLPNGGFSNGLAGWVGALLGPTTNGYGTIAYTAIQPSGPHGSWWVIYTDEVPVFANGLPYTFSIDLHFVADTGSCRIAISWRNDAGTEITQSSETAFKARNVGFSADQDGRVRLTATAPAGATKARGMIVWGDQAITSASGNYFLGMRQAKLEQGAQMSGYSEEAAVGQSFTAINSQGVTIATLSTDLTTAKANISINAQAVTTLTGQQSSFSQTLTTQGTQIATLQSATTTLEGRVATITTRVRAGTGNLLTNGGFENGTLGIIGQWGVRHGIREAADASGWGRYAFVAANDTSVMAWDAPVGEYKAYTASADVEFYAQAGSARIDIEWINAAGQIIGYSNTTAYKPLGQGFTTDIDGRLRVIAQAPAGARTGRVRFVTGETPIQNQVNLGIRQVQLEEGVTMTAYNPGASVTQAFNALSTLTTNFASLSSSVAVQGVTVSQQQQAIQTINGNVTTLFGRYALTVNAGGLVTGIEVNGTPQAGGIRFDTDFFWLGRPGEGGTYPFELVGGQVRIKDVLIRGGSIDWSKINIGDLVKRCRPAWSGDVSLTTPGQRVYSESAYVYLYPNGSLVFEGDAHLEYISGNQIPDAVLGVRIDNLDTGQAWEYSGPALGGRLIIAPFTNAGTVSFRTFVQRGSQDGGAEGQPGSANVRVLSMYADVTWRFI